MTGTHEFEVLHELVKAAREKLNPRIWDYLMGGADTETTLRRNRLALDSLAFRPRVLCDVETVETGASLLGHALRLPVMLAPIGSLQDLTPEGGIAPIARPPVPWNFGVWGWNGHLKMWNDVQ